MSSPRSSASLPRRRLGMTPPLTNCSGSGPTTTVPWTSQTPPDWVGGKVSFGVWGVSGPEPEPARHRSQLPQARCRRGPRKPAVAVHASPPPSAALPHPRRSWPMLARRRSRLIHSRRPRLFLTRRRSWPMLARRRSRLIHLPPSALSSHAAVRGQAALQWVWQAGGSCGKPAGRGSFQASASASTAPSRARSSTAPSSASSSTALCCVCALQCQPLDSAMLCPCLQSAPKSLPFPSVPKSPCLQCVPKCPIEPLFSPW